MDKNYTSSERSSFKGKKDSRERIIRKNWSIKSSHCRVIEQGQAPRVMRTQEAIEYAESLGLDLVEIGYDKQNGCSNCKVCDYSKFVYEQKKREKEAKKQARANAVEVKAVQLSLTTDTADKERIISHAKEFLANGDKVRIAIRMKSRRERENSHLAKDMMKEVLSRFDGLAVMDGAPGASFREIFCILRKA